MSTFAMCMRVYERAAFRGPRYANMACQFRAGHDDGCSWTDVAEDDKRTLLAEQEAEARVLRPDPRAASDDALLVVLLAVEAGDYDDDLELILSVAHGRKHARRGVRGFR